MTAEATGYERAARTRLIRIGIIGIVVQVAIVLATLQYDKLPFLRSGILYSAYFSDAGGLLPGDRVEVAGVKSGQVEHVSLAGDKVRVEFLLNESITLGDRTTAAIKTNTVLGRKSLAVTPLGSGSITVRDTIPLDRTTSPYSLNAALSDLSTETRDLDTAQLDKALDTLTSALANTPGPLHEAVDGLARMSKSLNDRDESLRSLLDKAKSVTQVLANRGEKINSLVLDGNNLLGELDRRRNAITELIANVSAVSAQLSGLVKDNQAQLKPSFDKLNLVLGQLQRNKDNISQALDGLAPFALALGEQVGNGPWFGAYVANMGSGHSIRELIDALVWPQHVPQDFQDYLTPPPSVTLKDPHR